MWRRTRAASSPPTPPSSHSLTSCWPRRQAGLRASSVVFGAASAAEWRGDNVEKGGEVAVGQRAGPRAAAMGTARRLGLQGAAVPALPYVCSSAALPCPTPPPAPQLSETDAVALDDICRGYGVKLVLIRSFGLVGYLRVRLVGPLRGGICWLVLCWSRACAGGRGYEKGGGKEGRPERLQPSAGAHSQQRTVFLCARRQPARG